MSDSFLTITGRAEGFLKEKGSKFIAIALPARSEEEVKNHLDDLRKEYYDARHHCYGYILGPQGDKTRANDDGEPAHSAGDPILGQIKSKGLTNTLVVVIRYFGGTKLGVGGLISAYKTSTEDALNNASIIETFLTNRVKIESDYDDYNIILKSTKMDGFKIIDQQFEDLKVNLVIEYFQKDQGHLDKLERELYASKFEFIDKE